MEIQLQELLDRIKREGVEAARLEAQKILDDAAARRTAILGEAEREAASIVEKAKAEAARAEEAGKAALAQASRDVLLSFRLELQALLDALVAADVRSSYGSAVLAQAIPQVLKSLASGGAEDLAVILPPAEIKALESDFTARLQKELKKGVELRSSPELAAGFRVSEKGGAAYYDFSAEAVAELFSRHLNSRLGAILREASKKLPGGK